MGFISNLLDFSPHPRRNTSYIYTSNSFYLLLLLLCFFFGTIRILLYRSTASKPITTRIVGSTSADSGYGCKGRAELLVQGGATLSLRLCVARKGMHPIAYRNKGSLMRRYPVLCLTTGINTHVYSQ